MPKSTPKLDLSYPAIKRLFGDLIVTDREESKAFLAWFLENYYHLDETEVDDSICDDHHDQGIDGIYVNELVRQIVVFQAELGKKHPVQELGDVAMKQFLGTLAQLETGDGIRHLANTTECDDLKKLLDRLEVAKKVDAGYTIHGVFVTNKKRNPDAIRLLKVSSGFELCDSIELEKQYVSLVKPEPIATPIKFSVSGVDVLRHTIEGDLKMILAPLQASELIKMEGIASQELFAWNLRYDMRQTPVNEALERSISLPDEHKYFPAFHNGLTVLCETLDLRRKRIRISGYAVVNGCQSLSAFHRNESDVTPELRVLTKFVKVSPKSDLAQKITDHTNNQNAITGRDRQSNNPLHTRVQTEIRQKYEGEVFYRIARGEHPEWDPKKVIENDKIAPILLAFDLKKPESCHQHYKFFDPEEFHTKIFGRVEVDADRVVAVADIDKVIRSQRTRMADKKFAAYSLTPYLFLYLLREVLETDELGLKFCQSPSEFMTAPDGRNRLKHSITRSVSALMRIMDAYLKQQEKTKTGFDYKKDLKSPTRVGAITTFVIPQYQIAIDSEFARPFSDEWQHSESIFSVLSHTKETP